MPGGFGTFGFGAGPAGPPNPIPGVTPTTLVASWRIDPVTQRYVLDADGNPLGMDGTEQRVYELVCDADTDVDILTPTTLNQQAQALRTALRPLVLEGAIKGLSVSATDDGKATSLKTVSYTNTGDNRAVTLRIR
jgi:hypothetical protein